MLVSGFLLSVFSFLGGIKFQSQTPQAPKSDQSVQLDQLPNEAIVQRIVNGDTVVLENGIIVRYVGITAPETGEPFEEEATEENKKLVEGKKVKLEYDAYKSDKFDRILAYIIVDNKNVSIELARKGLARVVIYQKRQPFIYQDQLLKAQDEAKKEKLGIWSQYSIFTLRFCILA